MKPATQSALILLATLIIGFVVGVFATGALGSHRMARLERLREREGFIEHMDEAIQPHDRHPCGHPAASARPAAGPRQEPAQLRPRRG